MMGRKKEPNKKTEDNLGTVTCPQKPTEEIIEKLKEVL